MSNNTVKQAEMAVIRAIEAAASAPILWDDCTDDGFAADDHTSRWIVREGERLYV